MIKPEAKNVNLDAQDGLMVPQSQKPAPETVDVYVKDNKGRVQLRTMREETVARKYKRVAGYQAPVYERAKRVTVGGKVKKISERKLGEKEYIYDTATKTYRNPDEFVTIRVDDNGNVVERQRTFKQVKYLYRKGKGGVYQRKAMTEEVPVKRAPKRGDLIEMSVDVVVINNTGVILDLREVFGEPISSKRRQQVGENYQAAYDKAYNSLVDYVRFKVMDAYRNNDIGLMEYLKRNNLPTTPPSDAYEITPGDIGLKAQTYEYVGEPVSEYVETKAPEMQEGMEQYEYQGM